MLEQAFKSPQRFINVSAASYRHCIHRKRTFGRGAKGIPTKKKKKNTPLTSGREYREAGGGEAGRQAGRQAGRRTAFTWFGPNTETT